jgi:hypothetical protein
MRGSRVSNRSTILWVYRRGVLHFDQTQCLHEMTDVENAVAAGQDPTRGRGANGEISRQLEDNKAGQEDALKSAV